MVKRRVGLFEGGLDKDRSLAVGKLVPMRMKEDVLEFLKLGAQYLEVPYQTYYQWLVERALLAEIHYYGWDAFRPVTFDRQQVRNPKHHSAFIHLDRVARRRARMADK